MLNISKKFVPKKFDGWRPVALYPKKKIKTTVSEHIEYATKLSNDKYIDSILNMFQKASFRVFARNYVNTL